MRAAAAAAPGAPARFELVSDWRLDAPAERVWQALATPADWPRWWRYVRAVRRLRDGDAAGLGAIDRFEWTSRLPYRLAFEVEVVESRRPSRLRGVARGELDGEGLWELRPDGDATAVRYTWRVEIAKPWMRAAAPLLAPLFRWNHGAVMRAGAEGLARWLDARDR